FADRGYRAPPPAPVDPAAPETVAAREEIAAVLDPDVAGALPARAQAERIESAPDAGPVAIGLAARRALAAELLPAVERRAVYHRNEINRRSDLATLNRQHFDVLSTSLSTVASGSPTDGTGLRFARRLFHVEVQPAAPVPARAAAPAGARGAGIAGNAAFIERFDAVETARISPEPAPATRGAQFNQFVAQD